MWRVIFLADTILACHSNVGSHTDRRFDIEGLRL
jgi:hypothetical protein